VIAVYAHAAFGLRIASATRLPGLSSASDDAPADVVVRLQENAPRAPGPSVAELLYCSSECDEAGTPTLVVARLGGGQFFRLRYADGVEFVLDGAGRNVWATWPAPWTLDDVATYLLGPVFGFLLRLRGATCLHASAVAIEEHSVVFAGPAGAGKSTLAAAFAGRGHAVMADDVVALSDDGGLVAVQPGPSRIRLWPESVRALYGAEAALPRLTPTWDKRFLEAGTGYRFQARPLALGAVFVLAARVRHPRRWFVESLSPAAGLIALAANTHASHCADARMRAAEFRALAGLTSRVPVYRAWPPDDVASLSGLYDDVVGRKVQIPVHV
jgi:hypothetical protein